MCVCVCFLIGWLAFVFVLLMGGGWKSGQLNLIRPQQLSHHFSPSPPQHRFTFIVFSYVFVGVHVHLYRLSWSHECWIDLLLDSLEL